MKYGYSKVFDPPRVTALYTTDLKEAKRVGNGLVKERGFTPYVNNPVHLRPVGTSAAGIPFRGSYEIWSEEKYYIPGICEWEPNVRIFILDPKHYDAEEGGE